MSQVTTKPNPCATARRVEYAAPAVNLHQDADGFTLEVEMPGAAKDGVEVTFEDGKLTLVGRRAKREEPGRSAYSESTGRDYRRVFELDVSVDADAISANIEQGLLTVRLPKAEASKPRKIAVA